MVGAAALIGIAAYAMPGDMPPQKTKTIVEAQDGKAGLVDNPFENVGATAAPADMAAVNAVEPQNAVESPIEAATAPLLPDASQRQTQSSILMASHDAGSKSCGSKHLCREMDSCQEAVHYLNDCGVSRLDGDSDGTPCEKICG